MWITHSCEEMVQFLQRGRARSRTAGTRVPVWCFVDRSRKMFRRLDNCQKSIWIWIVLKCNVCSVLRHFSLQDTCLFFFSAFHRQLVLASTTKITLHFWIWVLRFPCIIYKYTHFSFTSQDALPANLTGPLLNAKEIPLNQQNSKANWTRTIRDKIFSVLRSLPNH